MTNPLQNPDRLGLCTASRASDLITSTFEFSKSIPRYAQSLAADLFTGEAQSAFPGTAATEFGKTNESEARDWYSLETSDDVTDETWCRHEFYQAGCSPDALVGREGLAEFKCKPTHHITALLYIHKHKRPPPDYLAQTHFQMWVTGRQWCDLVYWHPSLPAKICRVHRDPKADEAIKSAVLQCVAERDRVLATLREIAEAA